MRMARFTCLKLLMHEVPFAASLARLTAGSKRAARMAMMAMTTSSSISVKARFEFILSKIPQSCNFLSCRIAWQRDPRDGTDLQDFSELVHGKGLQVR